jgi:hypothetical protein
MERLTPLAAQLSVAAALTLVMAAAVPRAGAQPAKDKPDAPKGAAQPPKVKLGLSINDPRAFQGYTLLAPQNSKTTYLIDMQGRVVRKWESDTTPGLSAYLLENGHLLRAGVLAQQSFGFGPGAGGRVQEFTWDGDLVWDFKFASDKQLAHHDICRLPNGNVLLIVWEKKTPKEAIAAGRRPEFVGESRLTPDYVVEVKPTGKTTGTVVWEWHIWDHLIQDQDPSKANYGDIAAHPERIDINFGEGLITSLVTKKDGVDKLKSLGYVGGAPAAGKKPPRINPDWTHVNAVAYNADFDQIMLSVHAFSEVWVIDHSTTTAEAAGHSGGRGGKGGDLLYRWGNPRAYRAGTAKDQRLFNQHNAQWIPRGLPGEGHLLVFNNGGRRPGGNFSSVDEIALPVDADGRYASTPGAAYGPDGPVWSYVAPKKSDFFSMLISGAQRLPNGNTFICSGINGTLFEVTPEKDIVWKYVNPVQGGPMPGGFGGPPRLGQVLPGFLQDMLNLTAEQKKEAEALQKALGEKLEQVLTDEQKKQLKQQPGGFGPPGGFGGPPRFGDLMPRFLADRLKLTDEQKKQVAALQKEADGALDKLLKEDQKKRLKEMQQGFAGGPGGPPPGGPGGPPPGGPGGFGPPGGPGGFGGFGPPGGGSLFRATRYGPDFAGLAGKELKPGKTVEELQPKPPEKK